MHEDLTVQWAPLASREAAQNNDNPSQNNLFNCIKQNTLDYKENHYIEIPKYTNYNSSIHILYQYTKKSDLATSLITAILNT